MSTIYTPEEIIFQPRVFINNVASSIEDEITTNTAKVLNTVVTTDSAAVNNQLNLSFSNKVSRTEASYFVQYEDQIRERLLDISNNTSLVIGSEEFFEDINKLANDILSRYPIYDLNWYRIFLEEESTTEKVYESNIKHIATFLVQAIERQLNLIASKRNEIPINTASILGDEVTVEGSDIIRQVVEETALGETANRVGVQEVTTGLNITERNFIYNGLFLVVLQAVPREYFFNTYNPSRVKLTRTADFRRYLENTSTFEDFVKLFLNTYGKPLPSIFTKSTITKIFSDVIKLDGTITIRDLSNKLDSFLLANNLIRL